MNATNATTPKPPQTIASNIILFILQSVIGVNSLIEEIKSDNYVRILINIIFLTIELSGILTNLYFFIRILICKRSIKIFAKTHYRAIIFYNNYTHICLSLCLHLSLTGLFTCLLVFGSHLYLSQLVIRNEQLKKVKLTSMDSLLSCNYIPILRDAMTNAFVYIMLLVMIIYRRADIKSINQKMRSKSNNKLKSNNKNDDNDSMSIKLTKRRQKARLVLLHSLPWVLSLGLALPRGLLEMRYDEDMEKRFKILEEPLSEELCIYQSKNIDIIKLSMWFLQSWLPIILVGSLFISYSVKDNTKSRSYKYRNNKNPRRPISRRNSTTTLGGMKLNEQYGSSRTLYSLHNYKEEVIKLVKSSPIIFYVILSLSIIFRLPYNLVHLVDSIYYLAYSSFWLHHIIVMMMKIGDYLHLSLIPLFVLKAIMILLRNSGKITEIRGKVKKLAENDQTLMRSTMNNHNNINNNFINRSPPLLNYNDPMDDNYGINSCLGESSQNIIHYNEQYNNTLSTNFHGHNNNHNNYARLTNNSNTLSTLTNNNNHHNNNVINNNHINNNNNHYNPNPKINTNNNNNHNNNPNNNESNENGSDLDDSDKPFMLSTV